MQEKINLNFEQWIEDYTPVLLNRACYLLSNKEDAEDLVQEVFYSAYLNYQHFNAKGSALSWLQGILYNKAMDLYKKRYKYGASIPVHFTSDFDKHGEWNHYDAGNQWLNEDSDDPENLLDNTEFRTHFYDCLESLPPKWNIVIKLCYLSENKTENICSELGITLSNYWKLLQRSRLQLRKCIDTKWFNS